MKRKTKAWNAFFTVILAVISVFMLLPLVWMVSTALKENSQVFILPPQWLPKPIKWSNFVEIFRIAPIGIGIRNSLIIAVCVIPIGMFFTSLAAFAFAKLRFRGKNVLFLVLLSTCMIPASVVMIPQFVMFSEIGWVDTLLPLIVPGTMGNIGAMFFLVQFMKGIPTALIESAKIDGAGFFMIYRKIIFPLVRPALATQVIFWFMVIWNDLLGPVLYLNSPEKLTLTAVIASLNSMYSSQSNYPLIMAGSVISIVPLLIIYVIFQRQIIDSLVISGIKG